MCGETFKSNNTRDKIMNVLEAADEILLKVGRYASREELIGDALRALLRAKPELRSDLAVELYRRGRVSLSRAAEVCGMNLADFKELLKEKGVKIKVPSIPADEVDEEVERILRM